MVNRADEYVTFTLVEGVIMNGHGLNVLSTAPLNTKVMRRSGIMLVNKNSYVCTMLNIIVKGVTEVNCLVCWSDS